MKLKQEILIHKLKKNKRLIIFLIGLMAVLIICINIFSRMEKETEKPTVLTYSSIREVVEYFECKYISEKKSREEGIGADIFVQFNKDLYVGNNSNERFFIDFTQAIARCMKNESFRIIDEKREITVIGIMAGEGYLERIYINGDSNYFGNTDSKNTVYNYKEMPTVEIEIESAELIQAKGKEWKNKSINFGTRESIYRDYDIYFDEGIKVKAIGADVSHIIFTKNYSKPVVNGLKVGSSVEEIQNQLGKPTFGEVSSEVFGYKGKDIYVFFAEEEIIVYKLGYADYTSFEKVIEEVNSGFFVNELLNKITDIWFDYDKYEYTEDYIILRYAEKGVQIQIDVDGNHGIVLYNNYNGKFGNGTTLDNLIRRERDFPENVYFKMNEDLIYIAELERHAEDKIRHSRDGYAGDLSYESTGELPEIESELYYVELDFISGIYKNLRIVSKTKDNIDADIELDDSITSYIWLDDNRLVYAVEMKGIFLYNMRTLEKRKILETDEKIELEKYENNTIYYNNNKKITI